MPNVQPQQQQPAHFSQQQSIPMNHTQMSLPPPNRPPFHPSSQHMQPLVNNSVLFNVSPINNNWPPPLLPASSPQRPQSFETSQTFGKDFLLQRPPTVNPQTFSSNEVQINHIESRVSVLPFFNILKCNS